MKKDVFISIRGTQRVGDDEETVELYTVGNLYKKKENYYLTYEETGATGFDGATTTLKMENEDRVTLLRSGAHRAQLIVEKGRRHQCCYGTEVGELFIGVLGNEIQNTLTDNGGNLHFSYSLDVNTLLASENDVTISVREV